VISTVALFIALGGVGYAATTLAPGSVGTKQLEKGAVGTKQLKKGAVGTKQLKNGAIGTKQLKNGAVTLSSVATALQDGSATTPSLRTLGTGALEAAAGNDPRLGGGLVSSQSETASGPSTPSAGPINFSYTMKRAGDVLAVTISGTGWSEGTNVVGHVSVFVDGDTTPKFGDSLYFNVAGLHMTFPSVTDELTSLAAGPHTFAIEGTGNVVFDFNDFWYVTFQEFGPPPAS
jgi:hypothetical protein